MNLYSSEVICNSTEGSTLVDFLHTGTLNCREKSNEFRESSKRMASECDITSERYCSSKISFCVCSIRVSLNLDNPFYEPLSWFMIDFELQGKVAGETIYHSLKIFCC